ncbi:MAG: hypothetical protein GOV02_00410 [Candidatus Aenigmarchaeota archaeon]|nr:hypothetical protein [Candidatus Aenigmarchaeota archaeon]
MKKDQGRIELTLTNPDKAGIFTVGSYWDKELNTHRILKWANGEDRTYKFNGAAKSSETLDLNSKDDKLLYEHIIDHPVFVKRPDPIIVLLDLQEEEKKRLGYEETALEAKIVVKELNGKELSDFARLFGINTENTAETTVKAAMYEFATDSPEGILREWNAPERVLKELLYRGRDKNVFAVDKQGVWKYNQVTMGVNFDQALLWLKDEKNEDLIPTIKKEVNKI